MAGGAGAGTPAAPARRPHAGAPVPPGAGTRLTGHRDRALRATRAPLPTPARKPIYFVVSLLRAHGRDRPGRPARPSAGSCQVSRSTARRNSVCAKHRGRAGLSYYSLLKSSEAHARAAGRARGLSASPGSDSGTAAARPGVPVPPEVFPNCCCFREQSCWEQSPRARCR